MTREQQATLHGLTTRIIFVLVLITASFVPWGDHPAHAAPSGQLVIVVNPDNPVTTLSRDEVREIFLSKRTVWAMGEAMRPCDLEEPGIEGKTARATFSTSFLNKTLHALKNYWIKMIFSGKGHPPDSFKQPRQVIRFVSDHIGGIGYLSEGQLTDEVKRVKISDPD